jgi:hypothetical protein
VTAQRVVWLPLLTLCAVAAAACAGPRDAITELGALYATRDGDHATYAKVDTEGDEIEEPVAFALEHLTEIDEADADDLEPCERAALCVTLAEMARLDRARVVRGRALVSLREQLLLLDRPARMLAARPVDEEALGKELDALLTLAEGPPEAAGAVVAQRGADLQRAAEALLKVAPDRIALAEKLARLAAKGGRRARDAEAPDEVIHALERAAAAQATQLAVLVARGAAPPLAYGLTDPGEGARGAAGKLLMTFDPVAATADLGRVWQSEMRRGTGPGEAALVRVFWLRELAAAPLTGANLHPTLRAALVEELMGEDAATAWWAQQAMAHLLARDPATTPVAELRSAWLALSEWQPERAGS